MKKIGIIGTGDVGMALAKGFFKHGFEVMVGSRQGAALADWESHTKSKGKSGTFEQTAAFADIVVLCVKGKVAENALALCKPQNLRGKIVIDVTNPIDDARPPENGVLRFFTNLDESLFERLQKKVPDVRFVKAFNSIGNAFMVNPDFGGTKPTMFFCGNDEPAKAEVKKILVQFGFEPEDMGAMEAARAIEPLCMLWCIPGLRENKWSHAFKLLKK